jgi:hypothetical protein
VTVTEEKLQKLIAEELTKFVKENQDEIVRRAWKRLKEEKGAVKDGAKLPEFS